MPEALILTREASEHSARFQVLRRIGAGGMGEVFEAEDLRRGERVAIKTLAHLTAPAIYRLKQEFRALADVSHPNLVSLYELVGDDDRWFFTMELIDGIDFRTWVRPLGHGEPNGCDVPRLRAALAQLAGGVHALHAAAKIHRDLKPSNVLVEPNGRVVVLDFGIVADVSAGEAQPSVETSIAGTMHYMAPEQAGEGIIGVASDWYAVGVMLFEALTGRLPFEEHGLAVLVAKQTRDAPHPLAIAADAPLDLCDLCARLLARDPTRRPPEDEILAAFAIGAAEGRTRKEPAIDASLVGREDELATLSEALDLSVNGAPSAVYVHGTSGMGKSTLVQHFVAQAQLRRVVVLAGRCYERESVPYKALDGVIDSLTRYLRTLSAERAAALLPRDVSSATRLFPVLLRVNAIAEAPNRLLESPAPAEMRRRGIAALRELLARVSDHAPLAIYIDDLQWADRDSMMLLEELRRPPNAPSLLFIASFRTEEIERKAFLSDLMAGRARADAREIRIDALGESDARLLAQRHLGSAAQSDRVSAIVREAHGNPLLIEQLAEHLRTARSASTAGVRLSDLVTARLRHCGAGARALLETLAVVAHPIDGAVAYRAAGLEGSERGLISDLERARLVRRAGPSREVEPYHDRVRETVVQGMAPESVRSIHLRLAAALTARGIDDPEILFEHALGGGDEYLAAGHALRAAERARGALAFDRAARFFRHALGLQPPNHPERASLLAALGETLANAGRPAEAAVAFDGAALLSGALASLENRRRAAEQLLIGGHGERGLRALRELLAAVGLPMPRGPRRALLGFLWQRVLLALRGLGWTERSESAIAPLDLLRVDLCWTCMQGLVLIDYAVAANYQARQLRLALRLGEPRRVSRGLFYEAAFRVAGGGAAHRKTDKIAAEARALTQRLGKPIDLGFMALIDGSIAFLRGEWRSAVELCTHAERVLREQCTGVLWELTTSQTFLLSSLLYAGDFAEVERRIPGLLDAALERGDLLFATELRTRINLQWLVRDEPDEARRLVADALLQWSNTGFTRQHYNALAALTQLELYRGDTSSAWNHINSQWSRIKWSSAGRVQVVRCGARYLRARAALAVAAESDTAQRGGIPREALLKVAAREATLLEREGMRWTAPMVPAIRGTIALLRGDEEECMRNLAAAADGFDRADMRSHAVATRWRLGLLTGGERGAKLVGDAKAALAHEGVLKGDQFVAVLAPWPAHQPLAR